MCNIKYIFLSLLILLLPFISFTAKGVDFEFNIKVDKQTCKLSIIGTSDGEVDFGSLQLSQIKNNSIEPISIQLMLSDCITNDFTNTYVTMVAKSTINNITFNNDINSDFGIRVSDNSNVMQSTSDTDFFQSGDRVWTDIKSNKLEKKLYTYVRCKSNVSCNPSVGNFSSTITFSFIVD